MSYILSFAEVILTVAEAPEAEFYVGAENGWSAVGNADEIIGQMGEAPATLYGIARY